MPTGNSQSMSAISNSQYYGTAFLRNPTDMINRSALASLAPFIGQKNSELMMNATNTMASNNIWSSLKNTLEVIRAVSVSNVSTETFETPLESMSFTLQKPQEVEGRMSTDMSEGITETNASILEPQPTQMEKTIQMMEADKEYERKKNQSPDDKALKEQQRYKVSESPSERMSRELDKKKFNFPEK